MLGAYPPRGVMEECNSNAAEERTQPSKQPLEITLQELAKTREVIKQAREGAVQAWLGSIPTIDELESSKCRLARISNKVTLSNTAVASLHSLLDSTNRSVRKLRAADAKSKRAIEEMQEEMGTKGEEVERLKVELELEDASRRKMRKELQIKRQTLETLQLGEKAARQEMEALNESTSVALRQTRSLKVDDKISLSHGEYDDLCRKAEQETEAANSRIILWDEKRRVAEMRKADALRKLEVLQRGKQESISIDVFESVAVEDERQQLHFESVKKTPKSKAEASTVTIRERASYFERPKRRSRKQSSKKKGRKKLSFLKRTRNFLMRLFK